MTAGKSDVIRKRLLSAGLSADACSKYIETLRSFLNARLTKIRFQDEMAKVLPKDKIHVHNSIIQEILSRAQEKRPGLPDLPIVIPIKRPTGRKQPPPKTSSANGPAATTSKGTKRSHVEVESGPGRPGIGNDATHPSGLKKPRLTPDAKKPEEIPKPTPRIGGTGEKPSPKPPSGGPAPAEGPKRPPTTPAAGAHRAQPVATQVEIPTYESLPYFPIRPGQGIDFEFFLKLRQRMRRIAVEMCGMNGIKDDAVGLMVHGVEQHVKTLMEAGARQRAARDGMRPHRNLQCGPVRGHDFRESARRNPGLLGDEAGMELERLAMLL